MSFDPNCGQPPAAPLESLSAQLHEYELSSALRYGVHTVVTQVHPGCRLDCPAMTLVAHVLTSMVRRLLLPATESGAERVADVVAELKIREEAAQGVPPPNSLERWDEIVFDRLLRARVSQLVSGQLCSIALKEMNKATPGGMARAPWRDVEPLSQAVAIECMRRLGHVFPPPLTPLHPSILSSPAFRLPYLMRQHVAAFLEFIAADWIELAGSIAMMTEVEGYDRAQAEADVEARKHTNCNPLKTTITSAHLSLAIRGDKELLSMMLRLGGDALERLQLNRLFDQLPVAQPLELLFPRTSEALAQLYKQFAWFHRSDAEIRSVLDQWLSGQIPSSPLLALGIRPVSWFGRSCFPALLCSSVTRYSFPRHDFDAEWDQATEAGAEGHNGPLVCIAFDLIDACGHEYPLVLEHGRDEGAFWDRESRLKLGEWTPGLGFAFASGVAIAEHFAAFVPHERAESKGLDQNFAQLSATDATLWEQARAVRSPFQSLAVSRVVAELLFLIHRSAHRDIGSAFSSACPLEYTFQQHHPVRVVRLFTETQLRLAFDSELVGRRDMPQVLIELIAAYAPVDLPDLPITACSSSAGESSTDPVIEFGSSVCRLQGLLEDAPNAAFRS